MAIVFRVPVPGGYCDFTTEQSAVQYATEMASTHQSIDVTPSQTEFIRTEYIRPARLFGTNLMEEFAAENVGMGISQSGKTKAVADLFENCQRYLGSGTLNEAIAEAVAIENNLPAGLEPYVTVARVRSFANRIRVYLGKPTIP